MGPVSLDLGCEAAYTSGWDGASNDSDSIHCLSSGDSMGTNHREDLYKTWKLRTTNFTPYAKRRESVVLVNKP